MTAVFTEGKGTLEATLCVIKQVYIRDAMIFSLHPTIPIKLSRAQRNVKRFQKNEASATALRKVAFDVF